MIDRTRIRFALSGVLLGLAVLGLGMRLALLHLGTPAAARIRIESGGRYERHLLAGRGRIYDRWGRDNLLALNLAVKDVCADPMQVVTNGLVLDVASRLAQALDLPVDTVAVRLNRPEHRFAYIQRFVPRDVAARIEQQNLPGVFFRDETTRHYPQGTLLCHVLGFVNHEGMGGAGVEQQGDRYLRGCPGVLESRVNALRQELYRKRGRYVPALQGAHVCLTIDQRVQHIVETVLDEVVRDFGPAGAWAIVQRVRTGEILAMSSRPAYDPNAFASSAADARLNRAMGCVYEPGSTLKPVAYAAALEAGTVTPQTVYDCEQGTWYYRGRRLRDYYPYGCLTVADGLKKSSNILTAKVALTLGDQGLHEALSAFGCGRRLGIDLPGEEAGILPPPDEWSAISATRLAIGQGVAVTALQMLGILCAIASDGRLMRPYVIREIRAADGGLLLQPRPQEIGRPVSAQTAATMRALLRRVAEPGGTGVRARIPGYDVAGKTGTGQKPIPGGYSDTLHVVSFAGFLPADDPEIGLIVVVDEPQGEWQTGGRVAAPAFSAIASQTVRCLDIPPTRGMIAGRRL